MRRGKPRTLERRMNLTDVLCLVTGLLWGYFFFPVFLFARIMADFVAEDGCSMLRAGRINLPLGRRLSS